ncbi:MAG TPA: flagellar export chaperone FliS [Clostridiales bacterium]|nr:flagellar export chaperone FliS [Clostridiales bacterium]
MIDPYKNYKNMSINTMTKGEQLVLLFDKAVQRMVAANVLLDENKINEAEILINKTVDIFNYLMVCLDRDYDISSDLMTMYSFINGELLKGKLKKDKSYLEGVLPIVKELRDTWAEAEKIARINK